MPSLGTGPEWDQDLVTPDEENYDELITKLARMVAERQLAVPAIVFLESVKPLTFLGNQLMIFLNPLVSILVTSGDYYKFVRMIEHRENLEKLIEAIEEENARHLQRMRELREQRKRSRKARKGLFGFFSGRSGKNTEVKGDGVVQQRDHQNTGD